MCCLQFKDMVLKFSGSNNKQYKSAAPAPPTFGSRNCRRPYPGFIDDTSFTPGVVHGEDYYTRTASTLAATGAGSNRHWQPGGGKGPGGSSAGEEIVPVGEVAVSREWTAQVEPGVQITFVTLSGGGNDLKRIRFRYRYTCRVQLLSSLSVRNHFREVTDICAVN
jgi:hypothetical protein